MRVATIRCKETTAQSPRRISVDEDAIEVANDEVRIVTVHPDRNAVVVHSDKVPLRNRESSFRRRAWKSTIVLSRISPSDSGAGFVHTTSRVGTRLGRHHRKSAGFRVHRQPRSAIEQRRRCPWKRRRKNRLRVLRSDDLEIRRDSLSIAGGLFLLGWTWYRWWNRSTILSFVRIENSADSR